MVRSQRFLNMVRLISILYFGGGEGETIVEKKNGLGWVAEDA
jgi:hypothetical protein